MIDKSAIIGKNVCIGENVQIGANSFIGDYSIIKNNTRIGIGTIINRNSIIGENNIIGNYCSIGCDPSFKNFDFNTNTFVNIGNNNVILDFSIITRATIENTSTYIGNNNIIASNVYIGHDCKLGNNLFLSTKATIAGFCSIEDSTVVGAMAFVHQKLRIGKLCMIGAAAKLTRDLPHYLLVDGNPALVRKINKIALERNNLLDKYELIKKTYNNFFSPSKISDKKNIDSVNDIFIEINDFYQKSYRDVCGWRETIIE